MFFIFNLFIAALANSIFSFYNRMSSFIKLQKICTSVSKLQAIINLISLAILGKDDILLEQDRGGVHHPDQEAVDVVLQVRHLLALTLHGPLESDQHLYQILTQ